jgi:hypothetical protein
MGFNDDVKLPPHIKIGGTSYIITRVPMGNEGDILFSRGKILISDDLSQERAEGALCHEIVEGWNELYHLNLKHKKIHILGNALHQLVKDNDLNMLEG